MDTISISDKVYKPSKKPFKSGEKINTVENKYNERNIY